VSLFQLPTGGKDRHSCAHSGERLFSGESPLTHSQLAGACPRRSSAVFAGWTSSMSLWVPRRARSSR
jgi:hypothetical protein